MSAADEIERMLQRAERRALQLRVGASAARIIVAVLCAVALYARGVHDGRATATPEQLAREVKAATHAVAIAQSRRDSTKATATGTVRRAAETRRQTSALRTRLTVLPATDTAPPMIQIDDLPPVQIAAPVADYITQSDLQHVTDSLAIVALAADVRALEALGAEQATRATVVAAAARADGRAAFWRGVKVGVVTTLTVVMGVLAAR